MTHRYIEDLAREPDACRLHMGACHQDDRSPCEQKFGSKSLFAHHRAPACVHSMVSGTLLFSSQILIRITICGLMTKSISQFFQIFRNESKESNYVIIIQRHATVNNL
jgi:hypothetical protein